MERQTLVHRLKALQAKAESTKFDPERDAIIRMIAFLRNKHADVLDGTARADGEDDGGHTGGGYHFNWSGGKYSSRLSVVEIAKILREDIKLRRKLAKGKAKPGEVRIPDLIGDAPATIKFRVYTRDHSSIYVVAEGVPAAWWQEEEDNYGNTGLVPGPDLNELAAELVDMMTAYRWSQGEVGEYTNTNFYPHVEADGHGEMYAYGPHKDKKQDPQSINVYWAANHARRQREDQQWEKERAAATN